MIDASGIYTPQRAQNVMSQTDIQEIFSLYTSYTDVVERVKVVELDKIRSKGYTLAIQTYIDRKEPETVPPEEVREQYFAAFEEVRAAEDALKKLLVEGGYVHEPADHA